MIKRFHSHFLSVMILFFLHIEIQSMKTLMIILGELFHLLAWSKHTVFLHSPAAGQ